MYSFSFLRVRVSLIVTPFLVFLADPLFSLSADSTQNARFRVSKINASSLSECPFLRDGFLVVKVSKISQYKVLIDFPIEGSKKPFVKMKAAGLLRQKIGCVVSYEVSSDVPFKHRFTKGFLPTYVDSDNPKPLGGEIKVWESSSDIGAEYSLYSSNISPRTHSVAEYKYRFDGKEGQCAKTHSYDLSFFFDTSAVDLTEVISILNGPTFVGEVNFVDC